MDKQSERDFFNKSFTLQGRVFFPKLLAPEANQKGRLQYSCMFAWDMGSNPEMTQQLGAFIGSVQTTFFPAIPAQFFLNPIKKWGVYMRQDGKPNPAYLNNCYWINASSGEQFPPQIVDQQRQPIIDPSLVYSGMNAVINVSFYKIDQEKKGVGVNVQAVMIMAGGEKEGGVPVVNVNDVFGGFAADMGVTTQQAAPAQEAAPAVTQEPANQQWPPQEAAPAQETTTQAAPAATNSFV